MGHAPRLRIISLSALLLAQGWLVFAAAPSRPGAKALFYTEAGTTVAPKIQEATGGPKQIGTPLMIPTPSAEQRVKDSGHRTPRPPRPATAPKREPSEPWLGIAYWIEWERPGAAPTRIADPARFVFQSGDRVRFHVKTNASGYLYLINRGPSGRDTLLFPPAGMPDRMNRVEAHREYVIPHRGWIKFDDQPGEEGLLFLLSPQPLTALSAASVQGPALPPSVSWQLIDVVDRRGAKDLMVETDDTPGQQATYLGAAMSPTAPGSGDGPIVTYATRLLHR